MKKIIISIVATLFISLLQWPQSPHDLVKKCINALGGEAAIKNYSNYSAEGSLKMSFRSMEFSGKLKTISKGRKTWNRIEVVFGSTTFIVFRAFNGKSSWMDRMNTIADQPALNDESELDHQLNLLLEEKAKFTFGKNTEIGGKKVSGINISFNGKKTTIYIDQKTFLPMEIVFTDEYFGQNNVKEMIDRRTRFLDYKKIDGVNFPMHQIIFKKGKKSMEMMYSTLKFNPKVNDTLFSRPDKAMDLRYREELLN